MRINCPSWLADQDNDQRLEEAKALCRQCPVLASCRAWALNQDVAGIAAGLTREQRVTYQLDHGIVPPLVTVIDVLPARDITPRVTDELPVLTSGKLHQRVIQLIVRLTKEGFEAQDIADRLNHPHVSPETVDYVRREYMQKYARVQQGVKQ